MTVVVDDDTTRAELAECLTHLSHAAKRVMPVVGSTEHPTPWDVAHRRMDEPIDEWLAAEV